MIRFNLKGTSANSFQIGLEGPTIYSVSSLPNPILGQNGDLAIQDQPEQTLYQKVSGIWIRVGAKSWTFTGGLDTVRSNSTTDLNLIFTPGFVPFRPGKIVGLSILSTQPRTAGTCLFQATKNSSVVGSGAELNASNLLSSFIELSPPVEYNAGDRIGGRATTVNFSPDKTDMTGSVFLEDI